MADDTPEQLRAYLDHAKQVFRRQRWEREAKARAPATA